MAKKNKNHALDKYVIFSISAMVIYTIISHIILITTGYTDSTLTTCFFGFFGGEIVTCALIKIFKLMDTKKKREDAGSIIDATGDIEKHLP